MLEKIKPKFEQVLTPKQLEAEKARLLGLGYTEEEVEEIFELNKTRRELGTKISQEKDFEVKTKLAKELIEVHSGLAEIKKKMLERKEREEKERKEKEGEEKIEKPKTNEDLIKNITLFKHRIFHKLLPLDIDIQGVTDVYERQGERPAQEYLEDVSDKTKAIKEAGETLGKLIKTIEKAGADGLIAITTDLKESLDQARAYQKTLERAEVAEAVARKDLTKFISLHKSQPFHKLFTDLDQLIDELRKKVIS